jgi:hypothetical protein
MKKKRYIPSQDGSLKTWLANFSVKIAAHGPTLGLLPADITQLQDWCLDLIKAIDASMQARQDAKQAVSDKRTQNKTSVDGITNAATAIKTKAAYTEGIGNDLGIIGEATTFDPLTFKTKLNATVYTDQVVVNFVKDQTDGINIYARKKGEANWTFLALDTSSPYVDNRPLTTPGTPETREYMGIGVIDDAQLPLESDVISVVFGGK